MFYSGLAKLLISDNICFIKRGNFATKMALLKPAIFVKIYHFYSKI